MSEQGSQFQTINGLRVLVPNWPALPQIGAFCTTRVGGISKAPFDSLNLGRYVNDEPLAVSENRARVRTLLPAEPVWLKQVHGTRVWDADLAHAAEVIEADAAVTTKSNMVLTVMAADCLPVLISDPEGKVIGAAHAGWRGLVDGVLEQTLAQFPAPNSVMAWLGPAIGPTAFEVGDEVRLAFVVKDAKAGAAFIAVPGKNGKWLADLYQLATLRLAACGITQIYGGGLCTYSDAAQFYSYRRNGQTGRMASCIWID